MTGCNIAANRAALKTVLSVLKGIFLPSAVIHVGAGSGNAGMQQWRQWGIATAWLIDANPERVHQSGAESESAAAKSWLVIGAALSDSSGESDYYIASNSDEDGLVPTQFLTHIWPNIRLVSRERRQVCRLDGLPQFAAGVPAGTWLLVDRFPSLQILKGAGDLIHQCAVVWVRVLLKPVVTDVEGIGLQEVEEFLQPLGFECALITEENHPAVGTAIFVRDYRAAQERQHGQFLVQQAGNEAERERQNLLLQESLAALAEKESECRYLQDKVELLTLECDAAKQLASELNEQMLGLQEVTIKQDNLIAELRMEQAGAAALFEDQRSKLANYANELEQRVCALTDSVARLESQLEEADLQGAKLLGALETLETEKAAVEQREQVCREVLLRTQGELADLRSSREVVAELLVESERKVVAADNERSALMAQLAEAGQDIADKSAAMEQQRQLAISLEEKLGKFVEDASIQAQIIAEQQQVISMITRERDQQAVEALERTRDLEVVQETNAALENELKALLDLRESLRAEVVALQTQCQEQSAMAADRGLQISAMMASNAEMEARLANLSQKNKVLSLANEEQGKVCAGLQKKVDELVGEKQSADKLKLKLVAGNERLQAELSACQATNKENSNSTARMQKQIDELKQSKEIAEDAYRKLVIRKDELTAEVADLSRGRDQQVKLLSERQRQIEQLQKQMSVWESKQMILSEEMTRAEAQIDLIKDVLFRESGL